MSNITKVSDLGMPHISGTVTVPLAELDRMRADHAQAIKLARELEDNQAMVKVVYYERSTYTEYDNHGHARNTSKLSEGKVEYKHFEDFRSKIAEEERERVQKKIDEQANQITSDQSKLADKTTKISELKQSIKELAEVSIDRSQTIKALEKDKTDLEVYKIQCENLNKTTIALHRELNIWKSKKSFWYWLTSCPMDE